MTSHRFAVQDSRFAEPQSPRISCSANLPKVNYSVVHVHVDSGGIKWNANWKVLDVHVTPILSSLNWIEFLKQNSILSFQSWICMPDCNISKPGLLISEAKPKPIASPHRGPAQLGLERARLGRLRAWGPAQHITTHWTPLAVEYWTPLSSLDILCSWILNSHELMRHPQDFNIELWWAHRTPSGI